MADYLAFAQLLNDHLHKRDRSASWLARRLTVHPGTVGRWINQESRPSSPEMVIRVADVLGVHGTQERQALLAAAGYGYQAGAGETGQPTSPNGQTTEHVQAGSDTSAIAPRRALLHLPEPATALVGRRQELARLNELMGDPAVRLLTISGLGGMGKTRLAIEVARQQTDHFADGAWFVPLASVSSPELLPSTIAHLLDIPNMGSSDTEEHLLRNLTERSILLVLDNYEHLLPDTSFIARLLRDAPGVRLLVTSRERLRLEQEWLFPLGGLFVPSNDDIFAGDVAQSDAVDLFVRCARRLQPDFALTSAEAFDIAHICRLVGGMPLGIEMAASWLRSVPLTEIADEIQQNLDFLATALRNVPEQHRSMRAVFDRSWHLLEQDDQQVLSRLAIFAGGCTRQAAQAVAGATLSILAHLVDSSWLQMDQTGRYGMHELARQYTWEKLNEDPHAVERVRSVHSTYYATFAAEQSQRLNGADVATATRALMAELDNLRLGWEKAVTIEDVLSIDRYAVPLAWLADARGFYREVMDRFDAAASLLRHRATLLQPHASAALAPQAALATLLHEMAFLSARAISVDRGYELASEAVNLRRKIIDKNPAYGPAYTQSLKHMATAALMRGDLELYQTIRHEIDAHSGEGADVWCTHCDGHLRHFQGRFEEAERLMAECSQEYAKLGNVYHYAAALDRWSLVLCDMDRADEAWPLAVESERIHTEVGHRVMASSSLLTQAKVATIRQEYDTAAKLLERCARLARETGNDFVRVRTCCGQGQLNRLLGQFAAAKAQYQEAYDIADRIGRRHGRTQALLGLAQATYDLGEFTMAGTLFQRSLQDGWQRGLLPEVLGAVVGLAGLRIQDNHVMEAAEWLAAVIHHPACPILIKVEAQQMPGHLNRGAPSESGEPIDVDNPVAVVDGIVSALLSNYD